MHRTGRTKPRKHDGNIGQRTLTTSYEYECSCSHRGWTTHIDIVKSMFDPVCTER